jgi:hypothetical protein
MYDQHSDEELQAGDIDRDAADTDSDVVVKKRTVALSDVKQALLSGALKAFIGVHESKKLRHLGINEDKLKQFVVHGETPVSFWVHDVPHDCLLREVAIS